MCFEQRIVMQITSTIELLCLYENAREGVRLPGKHGDVFLRCAFTHSVSAKCNKTPVKQGTPKWWESLWALKWRVLAPRHPHAPLEIFLNGLDCGESSCLGSLLFVNSLRDRASPLPPSHHRATRPAPDLWPIIVGLPEEQLYLAHTFSIF